MSRFSSLLKLSLTLLVLGNAFGAEVDSFTGREKPLKDGLSQLNKKTGEFLQEGLDLANSKNKGCDEELLYKSLRKFFNNQYRGELGKYIVDAKDFDANWVTIEESIYRDFKWFQAFVPGFWGRVVSDPSAALININGVYLGTDKFEHFLGSGYLYYRKNYIKGRGVRAALEIGESAETGLMGAVTTGVKAFGDLSANFNGMRFWNHILLNYDDVLGKEYNLGPYVSCVDSKWVKVQEVNWSNYIDHSFDEAQNCSAFPTKKMMNLVLNRISELETETNEDLTCPLNPEYLPLLEKKYGIYSNDILNSNGHFAIEED